MYKLLFKLLLLVFFIFIFYSCTPRVVLNEDISIKEIIKDKPEKIIEKKEEIDQKKVITENISTNEINLKKFNKKKILPEIEIILPINRNIQITQNFINSLEMSIYKKNIKNISIDINTYSHTEQLHEIIKSNIQPGKIFVGPLTSNDTKDIKDYCSLGVIFFSFASDRKLASECIYLINFFPEDDLRTLFNHFKYSDRVALLFPEDHYGYYVNDIIDNISDDSEAIIVNKVSYNEDISNARDAIKNLGKYEIRRHELERQKKILQNKNDEISKKALKKIEKFETIGSLDFTHLIIADYNIRLLEIAPLLPFYDIDPNSVQFVGTGVWDDTAFFEEPSLQKAIFPGVSKDNRKYFIEEYIKAYNNKPIRIATIMYDLVGLLSYIIENKLNIESINEMLNNRSLSFEGIDGRFSFENNLIKRELNILQIKDGEALLIK